MCCWAHGLTCPYPGSLGYEDALLSQLTEVIPNTACLGMIQAEVEAFMNEWGELEPLLFA